MTKYRKIHNGHWEFLQYQNERTFLFIFKLKRWCYVWKPYYDDIWGRQLDSSGDKCFVNSLGCNLKDFIDKWPNVNLYFEWAENEQKKLVDLAMNRKNKRDSNRGLITPL